VRSALPLLVLRACRPMIRATRAALAACAVLAACDSTPPPAAPTPVPTAAPAAAGRNLAMGTGEARVPEDFTIDQRLLDAVRRADRPTAERALQRGASIGARDEIGRGVVALAVLDAGDLDLARWLRSRGATVDDPDGGGRAPLSYAAEAGRVDTVTWLLEEDAVVDRRDVQQRTALFHAALANHPAVIALLVSRGAAVDVRDQWQDTPLIVACAKGNADAVATLRQHGADPALRDQEGRTAAERAAPGTAQCQP